MEARTQLIQDTRYTKQGQNTYPIRLRVTHTHRGKTIQKYFPTGESLTKADWQKLNSSRPGTLKDKKLELNELEKTAAGIITKLKTFSFDTFKRRFLPGSVKAGTLATAFDRFRQVLKKTDQIGYIIFYDCAKNSLQRFAEYKQMPELQFEDITPEFLKEYETWMLRVGKKVILKGKKDVYKPASISTVGMYLRCLRTLFNVAIKDDEIDPAIYPFGKDGFQIRSANGRKIALNNRELAILDNYQPEPFSATDRAKDFFFFMYYCDGINLKDLALLKYSNIKDGNIYYVREKTARTTKVVSEEATYVLPEMIAIIKKWGNDHHPDNYVFKILTPGLTPEEIKKKVRDWNSQFNKYLKRLAEAAGIEKSISGYAARHTSALMMHKAGIPLELSRRKLRHTDLKTTQTYFETGFDLEEHKHAANILTTFRENNLRVAK